MKLSTSTEWLFFHLWKKNPQTNTSCPGIFIVDTIIYRWAQPYFWYFTNKQGEIIRKTKEKILTDSVNEIFSQPKTPSGIVASYLISTEKTSLNQQIPNVPLSNSQSQPQQNIKQYQVQEHIEFEYFDMENFQNFLYLREKSLNALVQKFVQPKNNHNSLIKVTWSPQFCLMHRKTNINELTNAKVPFNQRLSTFEGPEYLIMQDTVLSPTVSSDLEQICANIVKHISDISGNNIQISRMVLYFKLDNCNRLWLLFCTSIKIRERNLVPQKQTNKQRIDSPILKMSIPMKQIQSELSTVKMNNGLIEKLCNNFKKHCSNCEKLTPDLYQVQFRHIIQSFDQKTVLNCDTVLPNEIEKIKNENNLQQQQQKQRKLKKLLKAARLNNNSINDGEGGGTLYWLKQNDYTSQEEELKELLEFLNQEEAMNNNVNIDLIPALILKTWGVMNKQKYEQLKLNQSFLNITTNVCDECYLKFTACSLESHMVRQLKNQQVNMKEEAKLENLMQLNQPQKQDSLFNENELKDEDDDLLINKKHSKKSILNKFKKQNSMPTESDSKLIIDKKKILVQQQDLQKKLAGGGGGSPILKQKLLQQKKPQIILPKKDTKKDSDQKILPSVVIVTEEPSNQNIQEKNQQQEQPVNNQNNTVLNKQDDNIIENKINEEKENQGQLLIKVEENNDKKNTISTNQLIDNRESIIIKIPPSQLEMQANQDLQQQTLVKQDVKQVQEQNQQSSDQMNQKNQQNSSQHNSQCDDYASTGLHEGVATKSSHQFYIKRDYQISKQNNFSEYQQRMAQTVNDSREKQNVFKIRQLHTSQTAKNISFNPAKIYKNKHNLKLSQVETRKISTSISSSGKSTASNTMNASKIGFGFMMNTIFNIRTTLKEIGDINLDNL